MGSSDSKICQENTDVAAIEDAVGFKNKDSRQLVTTFLRYAYKNEVNSNQMQKIINELDLPSNDEFYNRFKVNGQGYNARVLATYSIVVNRKSEKFKSIELWDLYDINYDGALAKNEAQMLITNVIECAVNHAHSLAQEAKAPDRIMIYFDKLRQRIPGSVKMYMDELLGEKDSLDRLEFENALTDNEVCKSLLDSRLIRQEVEKVPFVAQKFNAAAAFAKFN